MLWKIEKVISKGKYNYAIVRKHPGATEHGYVLEHRIVMENHLNRLLLPSEVVHHINGDRKDNVITNLRLMTKSEHSRVHAKTGAKWVKLRCPSCERTFDRRAGQTHLHKPQRETSCSRRCGGIGRKHYRPNIIKEYRV